MTLEEFAKEAGVTIVRCDKMWGGTYGYKTSDTYSVFGFKTAQSALKGWASDTFGSKSAKALFKLLKQTSKTV